MTEVEEAEDSRTGQQYLEGPQGRGYRDWVQTRRVTASCHLRCNLLFQENCLSAGGTRSEGRLESYARIAVVADA